MLKKLAILFQLALAFAALTWMITDPFMGELFLYRKRALLYQQVMGSRELMQKLGEEEKEKIKQNKMFFSLLSQDEKSKIHTSYQVLKQHMNAPFYKKCLDALNLTFFSSPPLYRAWIASSILFCLLILYGFSSLENGAWTVVFIALLFVIDNHYFAKSIPPEPDQVLFPTEKELIFQSLSGKISEQKRTLQSAWNHYLSKNWSTVDHVTDGEFRFNLARLQLLKDAPLPTSVERYNEKWALPLLILFFSWNFLFALILFFYTEETSKRKQKGNLYPSDCRRVRTI